MTMKHAILLLSVLALSIPLAAQPYVDIPKPGKTMAEMEPVLAQIAAWEYSQSHQPLFRFDEFVQGALASPAELRRIESRLLQTLPAATLAGKQYICRQLGFIGTDASVPVVAGLLAQQPTNDMARYALERIPGDASAKALREAVATTSGKAEIGVIDSLGQRRDVSSVSILKPLLASPDEAIFEATAAALAAIGDRTALAALSSARSGLAGTRRLRVTEEYLHCAGKLAAVGDSADALKVYQQLGAASEPETIRVAALDGLAALSGKQAAPEVQNELASSSPVIQAAAIRLLNGVPGPQATKLLMQAYTKATPDGQTRIITALGNRGDAAARSLITGAVKSSETGVRKAALVALSRIGDASSAMVLAQAAAGSSGVEQAAARESLNVIRGADAEKAIVDGIASAAEGPKLELIRAAGARNQVSAAGALLNAAKDSNPEVRREALRALHTAAGPDQTTAMLSILAQVQDPADRRAAAAAVAAAVRRSEPPKIGQVVAAYESAQDVQVRTALLDVMGQAPSGDALPTLRKALSSTDPEIVRASILALSEWQSPAPMPDLLELAKNGSTPVQQVLALRGYIKLISAPSGRTIPQTVDLIVLAMSLAKQQEEKRSLLALLPFYPTKPALALAQSLADDSSVSREARYAISRVQLALGARDQ